MHARWTLWILVVLAMGTMVACGSDDNDTADGDEPQFDGDDPDGDDGDDPDGDDTPLCPNGFYYDETVGGCMAQSDGDGILPDGDDPDGDDPDGDDPDGDDPDGDDPDGDDPDGDDPVGNVCPSFNYEVAEGLNSNFQSAGRNRAFKVYLPDAMETEDGPWPVVFFFYGSGDSISNFTGVAPIGSWANRADFPFIGVVPGSLGLMPPGSTAFDWDCLVYDAANPGANVDVSLFGDLLTCLGEVYDIDDNRVHAVGFSAGAIMTDLVSIAYADKMASIASLSGAYFSDGTQQECVLGICSNWSAYPNNNTNNFPALVAWGGESDTYSLYISNILFWEHAQKSITYLNGLGHDVLSCNHGQGHTYSTALLDMAVDFFKDHPKGVGTSPYAQGIPAGYPNYCNYQGAQ